MEELDKLIQDLKDRLGEEDFEYEADQVEWTDPKYNHQN